MQEIRIRYDSVAVSILLNASYVPVTLMANEKNTKKLKKLGDIAATRVDY